MGIISIGSNQYKHYHRLSERCRLMSCQRAGVNIDYFTLVVRAAGLTAAPYSKEISDDDEYLDMLGNGTADVGWALRRQDPVLLEKVFFTLPVTGVSYGYVTAEDRTKIRDSFTTLFFNLSTIVFAIFVLIVNSIHIILNFLDFTNQPQTSGYQFRSKLNLRGIVKGTYTIIHSANPVLRFKSTTLPSRVLLSIYLIAVLFFSTFFQSLITSILTSDKVKGYDVTSFSRVLDKLQWDGVTALIWPKFRLHLYCKFDECERWKQLANTRTIMAPDTSEAYFARLAKETNAIGFASIGDELLRANVIVYNRRAHQLFVVDESLTRQPFSFTISKKRRDLVEPLNRAIALTYSIYPRIMARYVPPYGVYSKQVVDMQWTPLSISSFDVIWQFEIICLVVIFTSFIIEILTMFLERIRNR